MFEIRKATRIRRFVLSGVLTDIRQESTDAAATVSQPLILVAIEKWQKSAGVSFKVILKAGADCHMEGDNTGWTIEGIVGDDAFTLLPGRKLFEMADGLAEYLQRELGLEMTSLQLFKGKAFPKTPPPSVKNEPERGSSALQSPRDAPVHETVTYTKMALREGANIASAEVALAALKEVLDSWDNISNPSPFQDEVKGAWEFVTGVRAGLLAMLQHFVKDQSRLERCGSEAMQQIRMMFDTISPELFPPISEEYCGHFGFNPQVLQQKILAFEKLKRTLTERLSAVPA